MLLQLTGRLDPGETYALIDLEGADLVAHSAPPSLDYVVLELVNITICQDATHNHFEKFPPTSNFPLRAEVWQEKITVRVPRPLPLVHRRRTRFFTFPQDPAPTVSFVDADEVEIKRMKRSPKIVPLTGYQVEYRARFSLPLITLDVPGILQSTNNTISKVIRTLQTVARPRIEKHFQRLLLSLPSFELDATDSSRRSLHKVKITLPPRTRLTCSSKDFLVLLGFESQLTEVLTSLESSSPHWGLVNSSKVDSKIFLSSEFVETATLITVLFTAKRINFADEIVYFYFERYPYSIPNTYLNFDSEAVCSQNPAATLYFFQLLLECVIQQFDLPRQSLRMHLKEENSKTILVLLKGESLDSVDDAAGNLTLSIRFGAQIAVNLGLKTPTVILRLTGSRKTDTTFEINVASSETDAEIEKCNTVLNKLMQEQFFNQTGGVEQVIKTWQQSWKNVLALREVEAEAEAERVRKVKSDEAERIRHQQETEAERVRQQKQAAAEAERVRQQKQAAAEAERVRKEKEVAAAAAAEAERVRQQKQVAAAAAAEAERVKKEQEAEAERVRQQKQVAAAAAAEAERVRQEVEVERVRQQKQAAAAAEAEKIRKEQEAAAATEAEKVRKEQVETAAMQIRPQAEADGAAAAAEEEEVPEAAAAEVEDEAVAEELVPVEAEADSEEAPLETAGGEDVDEEAPLEAGGGEEAPPEAAGGEDVDEEAPLEAGGSEDVDEEVDPWMEIEIDNPQPRPNANFLVANVQRNHICTPPHEFPQYCTVLLKEGEPSDHISTRGACSILGIIRNRNPNIVPNKAVVKNIKNMKHVAIEFIDEAFNTFKLQPNSAPMWIKIDLRADRNVYY